MRPLFSRSKNRYVIEYGLFFILIQRAVRWAEWQVDGHVEKLWDKYSC